MEDTIIRPYASAIFDSAKENNTFDRWGYILTVLSEVALQPIMMEKIYNPSVSPDEVCKMFGKCAGDLVGDEGLRLLEVLAENNRFSLLPDLNTLFQSMLQNRKGIKDATVISAIELSDAQSAQIVEQLEKRHGSSLSVTWGIDPEIIGGLVVTVGDTVTDASVRKRLEQMTSALIV